MWVLTGVKGGTLLFPPDSLLVRKQDKLGVCDINLLSKFSFPMDRRDRRTVSRRRAEIEKKIITDPPGSGTKALSLGIEPIERASIGLQFILSFPALTPHP